LIGAQFLSEKIGSNGNIGILTYNQDFYAINEREIAFRRWVKMHRPDLTIVTESFASPETAGQQARVLVENHQDMAGLFVVWDTPAQTAVLAMLGQMVPRWIALPGLEVTRSNVVTRYQEIWRAPTPQEVLCPD
jgi:ribose transport system substrate-binding protein